MFGVAGMQGCTPPPPTERPGRCAPSVQAGRRVWPPDLWDPLLSSCGCPPSARRKAELQQGQRAWAYDLPRAHGVKAGAPKRYLSASAAQFEDVYLAFGARMRHAYVQRVPPSLLPGTLQGPRAHCIAARQPECLRLAPPSCAAGVAWPLPCPTRRTGACFRRACSGTRWPTRSLSRRRANRARLRRGTIPDQALMPRPRRGASPHFLTRLAPAPRGVGLHAPLSFPPIDAADADAAPTTLTVAAAAAAAAAVATAPVVAADADAPPRAPYPVPAPPVPMSPLPLPLPPAMTPPPPQPKKPTMPSARRRRCCRSCRGASHSRSPTTGKFYSTHPTRCSAPPPRPGGDSLPGAEIVHAAAGK